MSALVTGARGFIGRHAARALARSGWRVTGLGHGDWSEGERQQYGIADWHGADVTPAALERGGAPDLIVHCAGSGSVAASIADPYGDFQRTVATTAAVLNFVRWQGRPIPVVYPSSPAVHGATTAAVIAETEPLRPISPYGLHKRMAEDLCRFHAERDRTPVAIVRLFSVYGAGLRKQLMWDACHKIMRREMSFFGTGDEVRDWLHVDDAVALLLLAAERAAPSCLVLNGGTGSGISNRDVIGRLCRLFDRTAAPTFSGVARPGDPARYVADITTARQWGWQPSRPLDDGLAEYVAWFKGQA